jgi:hypothetical protein
MTGTAPRVYPSKTAFSRARVLLNYLGPVTRRWLPQPAAADGTADGTAHGHGHDRRIPSLLPRR